MARTRISRTFIIAAALLAAVGMVSATQAMSRPANYKSTPNKINTDENAEHRIINRRAETKGKQQFAYFTNWGIYGANFQPMDIVPEDLTTILYSFADVSAETGEIKMTDSFADEQKHYPGDSWEDGNNLYGCLKQLYLMKLKQRNLKVVLSVGGWTYSLAKHFGMVTDAGKRTQFVNSAIKLIEDYGFDGLDIDFEFPTTEDEGKGFASLAGELRKAFDDLQSKKGDKTPYQLSIAVSAGPDNYKHIPIPEMDKAVDYWNLMAYDYAGSWSNFTDHQANLYGPSLSGYSTDGAITDYVSKGATASKITFGIPIYGRAFEETTGIGASYNGIGPGSIEKGVYSYKDLPKSGAQVTTNATAGASYSYDPASKEFVSYDTPEVVELKSKYILDKGLAGAMFWDLSTDKKGADSLVGTARKALGDLDQTENHINFPNSKWENIKNNMGKGATPPSGPSDPTTSAPAPPVTSAPAPGTSAPAPTTSASAPVPTGAGCSGAEAFDQAKAYTGGAKVSYNGHVYTAKWWTQNEVPGKAEVWTDAGAC